MIVTIGYVGLDRVRRNPDRFWSDLRRAESAALEILRTRFDIAPEAHPIELNVLYNAYPVYILCYIAKIRIKLGPIRRVRHFVHRQRYIPLFGYFRARMDRWAVAMLAAPTVLLFFALSASTVWPQSWCIAWLLEPRALGASWFFLCFVTSWILVTVAFSYPLNLINIADKCEDLARRAEDRVDHLLANNMDNAIAKARQRLDGKKEHERPPSDTGPSANN